MAKMAELADAEAQALAQEEWDAEWDGVLVIEVDSPEALMAARGELDASIGAMHDAGATVEQMAEALAGGMADAYREPVEVSIQMVEL